LSQPQLDLGIVQNSLQELVETLETDLRLNNLLHN